MTNPRPGFDNWRSQLDRPRACERAAPDKNAGSVFRTTPALAPQGRGPWMGRVTASEASQSPPHRHILRRARTQVRAFFSHVAPQTSPGSAAMPLPGYQTLPAR
ncbi:hypothetical protein BF23_28800 [Klebsiella variicola]|nr:hypothetical protein BF23_28800 [Klebsiella variicola]